MAVNNNSINITRSGKMREQAGSPVSSEGFVKIGDVVANIVAGLIYGSFVIASTVNLMFYLF